MWSERNNPPALFVYFLGDLAVKRIRVAFIARVEPGDGRPARVLRVRSQRDVHECDRSCTLYTHYRNNVIKIHHYKCVVSHDLNII